MDVASIYVNGVQEDILQQLFQKIPTSFRIGSQEGIRHFNGLIDEVRIWNISITHSSNSS